MAVETKDIAQELAETKAAILAAVGKDSEKLAELETKHRQLQLQADAIDLKMNGARGFGGGGELETKSFGELFTESEGYKDAAAQKFNSRQPFSATVENPLIARKSTIYGAQSGGLTQGTTGVMMPVRLPGVTGIAQQELRIMDLMTQRTMTEGNTFDFVQQLTRTNSASPQAESSPKGESTYSWNSIAGTIKTVAHFVNVSRQALADVPWLQNTLNSELMYGLLLKAEQEILAGDNLGIHMNGLITQATAYATGTYNVSGDTKLDKLRHAILQCRLAGLGTFAPDGIVVHPTDMHTIELIKDENGGANKGKYLIGDPSSPTVVKTLWNLPVVESDSITAGTFLVGAFGTAAEVILRQDAMIELSNEHASNFVANISTLLCEMRLGLAVRRPGGFIYGSY